MQKILFRSGIAAIIAGALMFFLFTLVEAGWALTLVGPLLVAGSAGVLVFLPQFFFTRFLLQGEEAQADLPREEKSSLDFEDCTSLVTGALAKEFQQTSLGWKLGGIVGGLIGIVQIAWTDELSVLRLVYSGLMVPLAGLVAGYAIFSFYNRLRERGVARVLKLGLLYFAAGVIVAFVLNYFDVSFFQVDSPIVEALLQGCLWASAGIYYDLTMNRATTTT